MIFRGLGFSGKNYLMDLYGTATAGYSLRRLRRNYRGPAIKVRRSSDNALKDIYFKGENLDTQELLNFVGTSGTDNGFVQTWYDQAGSNDATQTTANDQPKIVNSGALVTENGKAALDFDGTSDFLAGSSIVSGATNRSVFIAYKTNSIVGNFPIFELANGGTTGAAYLFTTEIALRCFSVTYVTTVGTINQSLLSSFQSGTTIQTDVDLYYNGLLAARESGVDGTINTNTSGFRIASQITAQTVYMGGVVQELIIYNTDKSALRTAIEGNIASYFDITLS